MTTMNDLVNQVRVNTSQGLTDAFNLLDQDWTPGQLNLQFKYATDTLMPGTILSSGLTTWQVLATAPLARQVEVWSSPNGEVALPVGAGSLVRIKPRFTDANVMSLLNAQIKAMSSSENGLFGVIEWDARAVGANVYDVPPMIARRITDLAAIYAQGSSVERHQVANYAMERRHDKLQVRIVDSANGFNGGSLHFVAKYGFNAAARLEDDPVANCGLTESMLDIPVYGASGQLMYAGESRRMQQSSQGDSRRPEEVPMTGGSSSAREWLRLRDTRIKEEYARLMARYPPLQGRW